MPSEIELKGFFRTSGSDRIDTFQFESFFGHTLLQVLFKINDTLKKSCVIAVGILPNILQVFGFVFL